MGAVDERLRMLDARANGERFLLQGKAFVKQRLKRIACAVSDSENDGFGRQLLFALSVLIADGGDLPVLMENTGSDARRNAPRRPLPKCACALP